VENSGQLRAVAGRATVKSRQGMTLGRSVARQPPPSLQPSHIVPAPSPHGFALVIHPRRCSSTFAYVRRNRYTFSNSCARRSVGKLARTCHD
jgi:hypothetical protein